MLNILNNSLYQNDLNISLNELDLAKFKNKKILILGATSLIGSSIADHFLLFNKQNNYPIKLFLSSRSFGKFSYYFPNLKNCTFIEYDCFKKNTFNNLNFDYLINCVGIASPDKYGENPVETFLSTFNSTLASVDYCKNHPKCHLLQVSSSEIYGEHIEKNFYTEDDCFNLKLNSARDSYPTAKLSSEAMVKMYIYEFGIKATVARLAHIYGPRCSKDDKRVSSEFPKMAADGKDLELKSTGLSFRSYCYSVDCARALIFLLDDKFDGEVFNVGGVQKITILDMAKKVAEVGEVKLRYKKPTAEELLNFNYMTSSVLNIDKLLKNGYKQLFDPYTGFEHTVNILKSIK